MGNQGFLSGESGEDVGDDQEDINRLTGKPHPDDVLLSAVPVCAPYHSINQYTYRVKLTPGAMKRGKASKQCVDLLLKMKSSNNSNLGIPRELDLIKQVGDNDWVQTICANVKISSAAASQTAKKHKANNKKKRK